MLKRLLFSVMLCSMFLAAMFSSMYLSSEAVIATEDPVVYATDYASAIYHSVSSTNIVSLVRELSEMGPRPRGSAVNELARNWIVSKLNEYTNGNANISIVGTTNKNILARLPGTMEGVRRVVMIGGHYDSVAVSPGANDNGVGVVTALELARVLSQYSWPLDIIFCFWDGEELGLLGSREVANIFTEEKVDILIYFNIDMLLVQDPTAPVDQRVGIVYNDAPGIVYQDSHFWADLTRAMSNNYHRALIYPIHRNQFPYWRQSDHYSFVQAEYRPVVFVFESGDDYDWAYHTSSDRWDCSIYNYTLAYRTIASIGATVGFVLSRTPNQAVHEQYTLTLQPGQSKKFMTVMTHKSELSVIASWSSGLNLNFTLRDPKGLLLDSYTSLTPNGMNVEILSSEVSELGIHTLNIVNHGSYTTNINVELVYESDYEGNGIPDSQEFWVYDFAVDSDNDTLSDGEEEFSGTNRFNADEDNDGLTDYEELNVYHTSPRWADSDFGGMPDGWEVHNQFNPKSDDSREDADDDRLSNLEEYNHGTHPRNKDTDSDGMPDGWEVTNSLNPLVDDASEDPDGDGLTNLEEYHVGTDPRAYDVLVPLLSTLRNIGMGVLLIMPVIVTAYFIREVRGPSNT